MPWIAPIQDVTAAVAGRQVAKYNSSVPTGNGQQWGAESGKNFNRKGIGNPIEVLERGSTDSSTSQSSLHTRGYRPGPGERTFDGYVKNTVSIDTELKLYTNSPEFNSNNGVIGGQFKRFGIGSHGGLSPHVHQPQRNVAPNGNIYGTVGSKTTNGGVTKPEAKDIKQLYDYTNNGKYRE